MSDKRNSPILSDKPALEDILDFAHYREVLQEILIDPRTDTPLTIGVFGSWGSGKTSLMSMLAKEIAPNLKVIWFDAWKYSKDYSLWRAFLLRVLDSLRPSKQDLKLTDSNDIKKQLKKTLEEIERLEEGLYRDVEWQEKGNLSINWPELAKSVTGGTLQLSFSLIPGLSFLNKAVEAAEGTLGEGKITENASGIIKAFQRDSVEHFQAQLRFIEQFQREFAKLVDQLFVKAEKRLVIFVDDLDRCLPEKAIEVLEAIKLFLDVPGCIFVLGLDQEIVVQGIRMRYGDRNNYEDSQNLFDGNKYIDKIIQLPFILPPIEPYMIEKFIQSLPSALPDPRCVSVFASGLAQVPNPRQVKRAINVFLLLWKLADKRNKVSDIKVLPVRLAKIVAIQSGHPDLYEQFRHNPTCVRDLEIYFQEVKQSQEKGTDSQLVISPYLEVFAKRTELQYLLTIFSDSDDACFKSLDFNQLRLYATLSSRTTPDISFTSKKSTSSPRQGRYELIEEIGREEWWVTNKGFDPAIDRYVALKTLLRPSSRYPLLISNIKTVVMAWGRLNHRNIVTVYDYLELDDTCVIVMQLIDNYSLKQLLTESIRLSWKKTLEIVRQIGAGLDYAHTNKVVHLDVRPSNILIDSSGQVRITDFGLANSLAEGTHSTIFNIIGTDLYVSPEQINSEAVSSATDVYAFAEIIFELIMGEPLFKGKDSQSIVQVKMQGTVALPSSWPEGVPQGLGQILQKALSREPQHRYQSAGDLVVALGSLEETSS